MSASLKFWFQAFSTAIFQSSKNQGGERTSQSRDQNIEKGYTLRNFLPLRTGKIDFLILWLFHYVKLHLLSVKPTSSWLSLHIKLFDILQVLQTFHYKGKIKLDTFTLFLKKSMRTIETCIYTFPRRLLS